MQPSRVALGLEESTLDLEALKVSRFHQLSPPPVPFSFGFGYSFIEAKEAHFSKEAIQALVGLATLSHEASESNRVLLARHLSFLVNLHTELQRLPKRDKNGERARQTRVCLQC